MPTVTTEQHCDNMPKACKKVAFDDTAWKIDELSNRRGCPLFLRSKFHLLCHAKAVKCLIGPKHSLISIERKTYTIITVEIIGLEK